MTAGGLFQFGYRAEEKYFAVFCIKRNGSIAPHHLPDILILPNSLPGDTLVLLSGITYLAWCQRQASFLATGIKDAARLDYL